MDLKEWIKSARGRGISDSDIEQALLKKGYSQKDIQEAFNSKRKAQKKVQQANQKQLEPLEKFKLLFTEPTEVFEKIDEPTITPALGFFAVISLIASIITYGLYSIFIGAVSGSIWTGASMIAFGGTFFVIGLVATFIVAGIVHLTAKILGAEGTYTDTYSVVTYSIIPAMVFSIIPYIGLLAYIYSIVLMTFGLAYRHSISKGKAVVAALAPFIIIMILVALFIMWLIYALSNAF
jgi:hypothetical protein